ncbi:GNAT family N-acetyltransferase [Phenylobacterium sp. J367]|uniref:GNAT family N-acetyltransferase n=1 Tax=Phenylobacterium sp. J367 TaxID=2898435 RepID=UPI0021519074|nr:GNAT family protein [Phenylobacterium sp. J367]MCR5880448.1 GNAT family N-acetyltransferase [Phenylobacterium sp. J367]
MILDLTRLPILETERLRLDPLTPEDAADIFPIVDDPEVMAAWDWPEIDDPDMVADIIRSQVEAMAAGRAIHWAIRTLGDARFVGAIDLTEIDRRHRRAEVGFKLAKGSWDLGYPMEALTTVTAYAAVSGLRKLSARTYLGARRSEALLEGLGFKEEGLLRGHILEDGERRDLRLFGLLL